MRQVSLLCRWLPLQRICEILPVVPSTAYRWDRYILQTELPDPQFDGLEAILVDEKAIQKGAGGFVTVVLNARSGELLHLAEGRRKESLENFFAKLTAEQKAGIIVVGMDRSGPYRAVVAEQLPQAEIVFDKFHIISNYNEVIDRVRRRSYRETLGEKRSFIKGQRFNLFRRPENVSGEGKIALAKLLEANADLHIGLSAERGSGADLVVPLPQVSSQSARRMGATRLRCRDPRTDAFCQGTPLRQRPDR